MDATNMPGIEGLGYGFRSRGRALISRSVPKCGLNPGCRSGVLFEGLLILITRRLFARVDTGEGISKRLRSNMIRVWKYRGRCFICREKGEIK